ncbi:MAG: type I restriction enzyme HsdR N-terminal domain-containing protein [Syntrophobacteraceae bacterium]|jgi:hypothetical protein
MDQRALENLWAEFCFILKVPLSTSESAFQDKVLRSIEKLGWSQFLKEIEIQPILPIGRGTIRPDLVIYSPERYPIIAIEVKKPSERIDTPNCAGQLRSYMRQMKADFGLLIGSEILVFYDGKSSPVQHEAFLLDRIKFDEKSESGLKFVEVFSRNNFLSKQYSSYVDEKILIFQRDQKIEELKRALHSKEIKLSVKEFLKKELDAYGYGEDAVQEAMKELVIEIRVTPTISVITPPPSHPVDKVKKSTLGREFRADTSAQDIVDTIKSAGAQGIDLNTLLDKALKHGWAPRSSNPEGRVKRIARGSIKRGIVKLVDGKYIYIGGTPERDGT